MIGVDEGCGRGRASNSTAANAMHKRGVTKGDSSESCHHAMKRACSRILYCWPPAPLKRDRNRRPSHRGTFTSTISSSPPWRLSNIHPFHPR